jgi:thymidylate synthase ThyX
MKIINQSYEILSDPDLRKQLNLIELAGRTAYKSEDKITDDSAKEFATMINKRNHEAVLEHSFLSVKFITDRGVSHEIVRHRLCSFTQESTRYVGYSDKLVKKENMSEDDIINLYEQGLSMKKISELSMNKFTEWEIYKILDNNDIERRNLGNKGLINETFFNTIDTPEKSYLMGFIQSDGNLRKDSYQISITQKNGWFIERLLKDFIKASTYGSVDKNCRQYSFTNKNLYENLVSKGIIPNKTYDMREEHASLLWNSIPKEFKYDFLRGLLDGDGSLRFFNQKNVGETESCNITWNGNQYLLNYIQQFLLEEFNYSTRVFRPDKNCDILYRISITTPDIGKKVCNKMYQNFIFPYGHPEKTSRAFEQLNYNYKITSWGHPKFTVIFPTFLKEKLNTGFWIWAEAMDESEENYTNLISLGLPPQSARSVLTNSQKTEIVVTANFREWKHIFQLRAVSKAAHPQMRDLMIPLYKYCREQLPEIFDLGEVE